MKRLLPATMPCVLVLYTAVARADITYVPSMADRMEPLWMPIFSGGIVFGLAVYLALRTWRAIRRTRQ